MFGPYEYATDPDLAGVCIIFDDGVLLQVAVLGTYQFYEVVFYLGEWSCEPCRGFHFRGGCSHVDRAKNFFEKMRCN